MGRIKRQDQEDLVELLGKMGTNRFLNTVMEASEKQKVRLDRFVADTVAIDIQRHLAASGIMPACPECGSTRSVKDGKRGEMQRYKCKDCDNRCTQFTGTILEKTNYTWDVWVEVVKGMLNGTSVEQTRQILVDEYGCVKIDKMTVWLMRMKVMYAVAGIPSPTLTGTVQFDNTFLREDQKASRQLANPLPKKLRYKRRPRYGRVPAKLGVMGNEFATVTTAIDGTGRCVCRVLACGAVPEGVLYDFICDHTQGIAYACSDGDETYQRVFKAMNVAHYQRPSNYSDIVKKAKGDERDWDGDENSGRYRYLLERLWAEGSIDRILNRGRMTFERFSRLKEENGLSLGRVNGLHNEIKGQLERDTRGVSTKFLPYYLAWFEFVHNRGVDAGHPLVSSKEAEAVLVEAIRTGRNITTAGIEAIRDAPLSIPQASDRYVHLLDRNTHKVRAEISDPKFMFGDEDGVATFDTRRIVWSLSDAKVKELARRLGVGGWGSRTRSALVNDILACPDIDDHLLAVAVDGNRAYSGVVYDEDGSKSYRYQAERTLLASALTDNLFCEPSGAVGRRVVFVDTETTGVEDDYDEIL